jgi:hypothetical protein
MTSATAPRLLTATDLAREFGMERREVILACLERGVPIVDGRIDKQRFSDAILPEDPRRGGAMDQSGRIYEGDSEKIPAEDKARLEGYLRGRSEESEAHVSSSLMRQAELRERKELASRLSNAEAKVPTNLEGK